MKICTKNKALELLLFAGAILGSSKLVSAADIGNREKTIKDYCATFQDEVTKQLQSRKDEMEALGMTYRNDLVLEGILSAGGDTTVQRQKETEDFMSSIYVDAIKETLKQTDTYLEGKDSLTEFFSWTKKNNKSTTEPKSYSPTAASRFKTGFSASLNDGLNASGYVSLSNLDLFTPSDSGRLEIGTNRFKICMQNAISDNILSSFIVDISNIFDNPVTNFSLSFTGQLHEGKWVLRADYSDRGAVGVYLNATIPLGRTYGRQYTR